MLKKRSVWKGFIILPENNQAIEAVRNEIRLFKVKRRPNHILIVVHGPTGCGKSTLMKSATFKMTNDEYVSIAGRDLVQIFETCNPFTIPLLIIEDLQYLSANAIERLVSLLDARAARRLRTIVTSNLAPSELTTLSNRLSSRLAGGLVVRIMALSAANQELFAQNLAKIKNLKLDKSQRREIRKGRLAYRRMLAKVSEKDRQLIQAGFWVEKPFDEIAHSKAMKKKLVGEDLDTNPLFHELTQEVTKMFQVSINDLRGPSQLAAHSTPRQVICVLAKEELGIKMSALTRYFKRNTLGEPTYALKVKMIKHEKLRLMFNKLQDDWRARTRKLVAQMSMESQ